MSPLPTAAPPRAPTPAARPRWAYLDNLKTLLVVGVIVAHTTMAWTGLGTWVFDEPRVREPLLSVVTLVAVIGSLFGMALFFLIAGLFTPASFARKGARQFAIDRAVRLGVPMVFFMVALSPIIEYADPDNVGWDRGFLAFTVHTWWPPVPGPTWFLGVLLLFSLAYVGVRTVFPARDRRRTPPSWRVLVSAGVTVAVASYFVRFVVPLGDERWHLALGQAPAWIVGFVLGVLAAERGWFDPLDTRVVRRARQVAWAALAGCVIVFAVVSAASGDVDAFGGQGTWQSSVIAVLEGALVVALSLWVVDLFQRRLDHQGRLARELGRAAFAAFVVHQLVLVGLVLASRQVAWPPEVEYGLVSVLGVLGSFGIALVLIRLPGVSRVL